MLHIEADSDVAQYIRIPLLLVIQLSKYVSIHTTLFKDREHSSENSWQKYTIS